MYHVELRAWCSATPSADVGLLSAWNKYSQLVLSLSLQPLLQPATTSLCRDDTVEGRAQDCCDVPWDVLAGGGEDDLGLEEGGGAGGPGLAAVSTPRRWPARTPDFIRWYCVD